MLAHEKFRLSVGVNARKLPSSTEGVTIRGTCNSISYGLATRNPFHSPCDFLEADYLSHGEFPTIDAHAQTLIVSPAKPGAYLYSVTSKVRFIRVVPPEHRPLQRRLGRLGDQLMSRLDQTLRNAFQLYSVPEAMAGGK